MDQCRKVVISGLGVISPIGQSVTEVFSALAGMASGISLLQTPLLKKNFPAGQIGQSFEHHFQKLELPYLDRCQQLAILAASQAVADAGLDNFAADGLRAGIFYGNVHGGSATEEGCFRQFLLEGKQTQRPFSVMAIMQNCGAAQIAIRHQVMGPVHTHGSACAASGAAIGEAMRAIRDGYLDVAIAGGAEAPLTPGFLGLFDGTRALASPDPDDVRRSCRPFSRHRRGLVLGEGAAFLVLEEEGRARRRKARCHAYLSGYGVAADAYHVGVPHTRGQVAAIQAALADARLAPADIDYLNAHATATGGGDVVEAETIRKVFGAGAESVPVSSTKSLHGHLLGGASAMEVLISVLALKESMLPATANLEEPDPACQLNHVAMQPLMDRPIDQAMSLSSGFGGTNVALIVSKHGDNN